jgi:hypothetical protein
MQLKQKDIIDNLKKGNSYPHPESSVKVIELISLGFYLLGDMHTR